MYTAAKPTKTFNLAVNKGGLVMFNGNLTTSAVLLCRS